MIIKIIAISNQNEIGDISFVDVESTVFYSLIINVRFIGNISVNLSGKRSSSNQVFPHGIRNKPYEIEKVISIHIYHVRGKHLISALINRSGDK